MTNRLSLDPNPGDMWGGLTFVATILVHESVHTLDYTQDEALLKSMTTDLQRATWLKTDEIDAYSEQYIFIRAIRDGIDKDVRIKTDAERVAKKAYLRMQNRRWLTEVGANVPADIISNP
jgi:hypothetical protein